MGPILALFSPLNMDAAKGPHPPTRRDGGGEGLSVHYVWVFFFP